MRRKTILALGLTLLAMLMLVAAGCGGGGSKNTAATTEATTTAAATTEAAMTEAMTTEAAMTSTATTTPALSGIASTGNCKELADLTSKLSAAYSGTGSAADVKKAAAILNGIADKAPSDIKADFKTYAAFVTKVADAVGGLKPGQVPDAATLQKLQGLQADSAKVATASQNIGAWVTKNCHA